MEDITRLVWKCSLILVYLYLIEELSCPTNFTLYKCLLLSERHSTEWQNNITTNNIWFYCILFCYSIREGNASNGTKPRVHGTPVTESSVLSRPHQILATLVVGMLIKEPVPIHYIARMDVVVVESIIQ